MADKLEKTGVRINKAIARAGVCSRRRADELILHGAVKVNGMVTRERGLMLSPSDELVVEDRRVELRDSGSGAENFIYIMLHKPVHVVCTARDPEGRRTVLDLLREKYAGRRIYPVGRLDYFSEGLLLLTDDGELAARLTHPRFHLPKRYELLARTGTSGIPEEILNTMRNGMTLAEGDKLAPVEIRRLKLLPGRGGELVELTLYQGVNRQIRRMCRDARLTVLRLTRVGEGPLALGRLPKGRSRELTAGELAALRAAVGL
ncbi:MAG: rRNA pseudouridine synthase [Deltaproteobacteria bacterium]|jgi:23S rRNA pseudouridine2605 synthase|nr:rRNA pseudouridine synthase [Deltaproteobacteria bacterium]